MLTFEFVDSNGNPFTVIYNLEHVVRAVAHEYETGQRKVNAYSKQWGLDITDVTGNTVRYDMPSKDAALDVMYDPQWYT